jgi:hypothetical protein
MKNEKLLRNEYLYNNKKKVRLSIYFSHISLCEKVTNNEKNNFSKDNIYNPKMTCF